MGVVDDSLSLFGDELVGLEFLEATSHLVILDEKHVGADLKRGRLIREKVRLKSIPRRSVPPNQRRKQRAPYLHRPELVSAPVVARFHLNKLYFYFSKSVGIRI